MGKSGKLNTGKMTKNIPEKSCRDTFAENLRRMRKERMITQEELAFRSDLTPSYISKIERKNEAISLRSLERIANALNVSCVDLLKDTSKPIRASNVAADEITALLKGMKKEDVQFVLQSMRALVQKFRKLYRQ